MCICEGAYIYVYLCVCPHVFLCEFCMFLHVFGSLCMCMSVYVCMCVSVRMYVCMCVCLCKYQLSQNLHENPKK